MTVAATEGKMSTANFVRYFSIAGHSPQGARCGNFEAH